jgi:hypothetical protein
MSGNAGELGTRPSGLPPANLAEALAPTPGRGSRLGGRLAPARPTTPRLAGVEPSAPPPAAVSSTPVRPAPERPQQQASRGAPRTVIVYVPVSVRDRLRKLAAEQDVTYTQLVLDALDATHEQLGPVLSQRGQTKTRSLFQQPAVPRRRRHEEPHVQVSLRLVPEDLAVIDRLTDELNAGSRSHLVATALKAYLS